MIFRHVFRPAFFLILFVSSLVALLGLGGIPVVHAATVTVWTDGTGTGLWSNAGNWSNGVPDPTKVATFDDTYPGGSDATATIDLDSTASGLNIVQYSGPIVVQQSLTVGADGWSQSSGTVDDASIRGISVAGNWSVTPPGTFLPEGGTTVEFNAASGTQTISSYSPFNNLVHSGFGTLLLESPLRVTGTLQSSGTLNTNHQAVSAGTLQLSSGSLVTTINTPLTVSGTASLSSEDLSVSNASVPSGEIFTVLSAGTLSGTFATTEFSGTVSYQGNAVVLTAAVTGTDLALANIPADITTAATGSSGASVTYASPTAADDSRQFGAVSCTPASGSTFPIGTTTVTCTASDSDDTPGAVSGSFTVTVQPTLTVSGTSVSTTEGSSASLVVATGSSSGTSGSLTASIDWGDGSSSTVSVTPANDGSYSVSASHTYAEEGQNTIHIVVSDGSGQSASTTSSVSVSDAALTFKQFAAGQVKQLSAGLAALFADADPAGQVSDYQATISWGDGTTSPVKVIKNPLGQGFVLAGEHSYARNGTYTVTLTVTDQGGSQLTKAVQVSVK